MTPARTVLFVVCWLLSPKLAIGQNDFGQQDPARPSVEDWLVGKSTRFEVSPEDDDETRLLKQRVNIAQVELQARVVRHNQGTDPMGFLVDAHKRLIEAQLELLHEPKEILAAFEQSLAVARNLESTTLESFKAGTLLQQDCAKAIYFRLDAEIALLRAKKKFQSGDGPLKK